VENIMSRITRFSVSAVLFAFGVFICAGLPAEELRPDAVDKTVATIVNVWKARQDSVRTVRFIYGGKESAAKESLSPPGRSLPKPPEQGISFDANEGIMLDGDKMRYQIKGSIWDAEKGELVPNEKIFTFDGEESKDFWPKGTKKADQGYINTIKHNSQVTSLHALPILMLFRPFHSSMGFFKPERYVVGPQPGVIGDRTCLILNEVPEPTSTRVRAIWVDPARDYVVCRYAISTNGQTHVKLDISYQQDPKHGWVPSEWDVTELASADVVLRSFTAKVSDYAINVPLDAALFQVDFPAGTWVTDFREKSDLGSHSDYLVRPNGTKRPILRREIGAKYEQLQKTESGMALVGSQESLGAWRWFVALTTLVTVVAFVAAGISRWARQRFARKS
jgi:hypothetical protein